MRAIEAVAADRPINLNPGPAPMLDWIEIKRLVVDDTYQRDLKKANWQAIRRIAAGFKWSRFSPVFCAPIEGGLFAIIDGQHRTHAAAICGFEKVPCQVVQMDRDEQAASFAAVNGMVTKITSTNLFKAALAAGQDWATEATAIATEAGCTLMLYNVTASNRKPGQIFGSKTFCQVIRMRPRAAIVQALTHLMAAEGYRDTVETWDMTILQPMLLAMTAKPSALGNDDFVSFLEGFDVWAVVDGIEAENKRRVRLGMPRLTRKEQLRGKLEEEIAATFLGKGEVA